MKIDARHIWAAEKLNVKPEESILEVGCGFGITAALVAKRLKSDRLTVIDRSAAMVTKASIRNKDFIAQGKKHFIQLLYSLLHLHLRRLIRFMPLT